MTWPEVVVDEVAASLVAATSAGRPIGQVSERLGATDVDAAYAVQQRCVDAWRVAGRRTVGRKIGLTNPAVQAQLGVDRPDFGWLFDDMRFETGARVPAGHVLQARVEAEVAFELGADLDRADLSVEDIVDAVAAIRPAIEIVGSRIADWKLTIVDTIADNASSGAFVVGERVSPVGADRLAVLRDASMTMVRRRVESDEEVVSTGTGADCLGSPLLSTLWLAEEMVRRGEPLRAGELVLTGALGPMVTVRPGEQYAATISGVGTVDVAFD